MTHPADDPRMPGERRLPRPPSDRYGAPAPGGDDDPAPAAGDATGSMSRGLALGTIAALGGAVAVVVLGGVMAISAGLLVVAVGLGYVVGVAVMAGTGTTSASPAGRRAGARRIALALAVVGIVLGQVGLWLFARSQGGVLTVPDYLGQTFGLLVPLQVVLATMAAWWTTR